MQSSRVAPLALRTLSGSARRAAVRSSSWMAGAQARNLHVQVPAAMYMRSDRLK